MMRCAGVVIAFALWADVAGAEPVEQGCTYRVTPLATTVPGSGGGGQVSVTTGAGCAWTASTGSPWLSVGSSGGVGSGSVTWTAVANTSPLQRFGALTVAGRTVFVSQPLAAAATAPPAAPGQLVATVAGASVTLNWSTPTSGSPTTYVLAAGSASGWSNLGSFATGNQLTTFTANNLPNGTYFVRVSAQNTAGTSPASNEVNFSMPQTCAMSAPSALQSTVNGSLVTLSWTAPSSGAAAAAYVLEVGSAALLANLATFNTGSTATTFAAHAPPGSYFVRVRAVTACGVTPPTEDVALVVQP